MYQIYSNILHPCILCKWEESPHWPPPLRFSLPPCPLKQRRGQVSCRETGRGSQLLSVCFPTCTAAQAQATHLLPLLLSPEQGLTWNKDSSDDSKPREGSTSEMSLQTHTEAEKHRESQNGQQTSMLRL